MSGYVLDRDLNNFGMNQPGTSTSAGNGSILLDSGVELAPSGQALALHFTSPI